MNERADAHIHLFEGGFQGGSFSTRSGVQIDEPVCYESLMADHNIKAALVVGVGGYPSRSTNNAFLAEQVAQRAWVHPTAFVQFDDPPSIEILRQWREQGFVGITIYILGDRDPAVLHTLDDDLWRFCIDNNWLVSVNSRREKWKAWPKVLDRHPQLRLVISHLGLPPAVSEPPGDVGAMQPVTALASYPQVRVKLSGFYALSDPGYDYPHRAAWPYVEALIDAYSVERLLWASDFSPCLDSITFPQTLGVLRHMPFLNDADRVKIEGENLMALLKEAKSAA